MSTLAQTIAGDKTFNGTISANKLILPNKLNILIDKTYGISRIMFLKN